MTALRTILVLTFLCGLAYPLALTGLATLFFPHKAAGSLIMRDRQVHGSTLIGREYEDPHYFWSRPSFTPGFAYNSSASSGSNLGPNNPALRKAIEARLQALQKVDPGNQAPVPVDLLTSSGSGLDPHISPESAAYQAARIARLRGVERTDIEELIRRHTQSRQLGVLGQPTVNVMLLNQDLDKLCGIHSSSYLSPFVQDRRP